MHFKDRLVHVIELKSKGASLSNIIDYLHLEKTHHIEAINLIIIAFNLNRDEAEIELYKNSFYSKMKNESNPFTEDFLDSV